MSGSGDSKGREIENESFEPDRRGTVVLVAPDGSVLGKAPKLVAHQPPGLLHLAFSVVLYRGDGAVLVQQRAAAKYHFRLRWANACCSHPSPGEDIACSAERRVVEELGIDVALTEVGSFVYRAACRESGLVEHELDHVFIGVLAEDQALAVDPDEVAAVRFLTPLEIDAAQSELDLVPWFLPALALAERHRRTSSVRT